MPFGYTPSYSRKIFLKEIDGNIHSAIEAVLAELGWTVTFSDGSAVQAYVETGEDSFEVNISIDNSEVLVRSESSGNSFGDGGVNKNNVELFISTLLSRVSPEGENVSTEEKNESGVNEKRNPLGILIPSRNYFVTPILVYINIALFLIMVLTGTDVIDPSPDDLVLWGANFRPVTLAGEWWRLLTCCFLHIGIIHLLLNMYALMSIGVLLEPLLGKGRFLVAYLSAGICGSAASLFWHPYIVSAGASGAIFGLYGVFLALLTTSLIEKQTRSALLGSIVIFVGYNLVAGLQATIDNAAHIGGLISGMLIGYVCFISLSHPENNALKKKVVSSISVFGVMIALIVCVFTSDDMIKYQKKMEEFSSLEEMALEIYHGVLGGPEKADVLNEIDNRGIYYWNECINKLKEADNLDLPEFVYERNQKLIAYCQLRIDTYKLIRKAIADSTDRYKPEIEALNLKVEKMLKEFAEE